MRMLTVMNDETLRTLHIRSVRLSTDAVGAVAADQLDAETPCADWDLRALLNHMSVQNRGFAAAARGLGDDPGHWEVRDIADPVAEYLAASADILDAFAAPDLFDRTLALPEIAPGYPFPAGLAMSFHLVDSVVHAWDVARAIGATITPDPELAAEALRIAASVPDDENRLTPGAAFAPARTVPADSSPLDQTLLLLGRNPNWPA